MLAPAPVCLQPVKMFHSAPLRKRVNIYSRRWFLSCLIWCQIDSASSLNKNSKLCVFVTNKHELLRRQPVIISTPPQTHNWQGADAWKDEQHHLYRTIRGWLFSPPCARLPPRAILHNLQSLNTPHPLQLRCLNQFFLTWRSKGGREKREPILHGASEVGHG